VNWMRPVQKVDPILQLFHFFYYTKWY
jgi:hypothetical protein